MRVAIVHSFYSKNVPSGENQVVMAQKRALESSGHEVELIAWYTDQQDQVASYPLKAAWWTVSGSGGNPEVALSRFAPHVVHVHNLYPNIGTKWLRLRKWPLVASLHNYRPVCANGLLYRSGQICYECIDQSWTSAIRNACYRDSKLATVPLAIRNKSGVHGNALLSHADLVTVPSQRAYENYILFGLDKAKLVHLPYFVEDLYTPRQTRVSQTPNWLIASRLSTEKGVLELLKDWPQEHQLDIAGSGPEEEYIRECVTNSVRLVGFLSEQQLSQSMPKYAGLIFPGRSPEGIPTMALQALAAGLPVVARTGNGAADLVEIESVGATYCDDSGGASLRQGLNAVLEGGAVLRRHARVVYERDFSKATWMANIEDIYARAIDNWSANGE